MLKIDHEESFKAALVDGVNFFLGSGFSTLAQDGQGSFLPTSEALVGELRTEFETPHITQLDRLCTFIESSRKDELNKFLTRRFRIEKEHELYKNILKTNISRIFTTNIDNLVHRIFIHSTQKYISDVTLNGASVNDPNSVEYIPIHGCVEHAEPRYIFSAGELASSYQSRRNSWEGLRSETTKRPIVFIGFGYNDSAIVQALYSGNDNGPDQRGKWILLREPNEADQAYFEAIGFNVIIGSVRDLLEYFGANEITIEKKEVLDRSKSVGELFSHSRIPQNAVGLSIRPIENYFLGDAPVWSDIFNNRLAKTHHFKEILNLLHSNKNLVVTGIPGSGKTTLMMQVAVEINRPNRLMFDSLTINKAKLLCGVLNGQKALILVDNFTDDIESFIFLSDQSNIQLVGFDRHFNLEVTLHMIHGDKFNIHDVTELTSQDCQLIFDKIPLGIRTKNLKRANKDEGISLFEFVNYNLNKPSLNQRYSEALQKLKTSNWELLEMLVLCSYVHSCRVPVSFDLVNAYLGDSVQSYDEIYARLALLKGLVNEYIGPTVDNLNESEEYYKSRSVLLAETILAETPKSVFRDVYMNFHNFVPQHLIPNYHIFKRKAFDASFVHKAFPNWKEGKDFYAERFKIDRTPFLLQQSAIYLMQKKRLDEAAYMIDHAVQISWKKFFTIENTHAIIMFQANIGKFEDEQRVRAVLERSMKILVDCYTGDKRKTYHINAYAKQAVQFFDRYGDDTSRKYLDKAKDIINTELSARSWNRSLRDSLRAVTTRL